MKKFGLTAVLFCLCALNLSAMDPAPVLLKSGEQFSKNAICDQDQFGIMIETVTDPETGKKMRRFVPYSELNPISLQLFSYCDAKAVERTGNAVNDRTALLMKKFKGSFPELEKAEDLSKKLSIHTGVPSYKVFFIPTGAEKTGMTGYLFSDAADSQFYGIVFLYGLIDTKGVSWVGEIYPEERTVTLKNRIYPVFTVIPPPGRKIIREEDREPQHSGSRGEGGRHGRPDGKHRMPPPPQGDKTPPQGMQGKMPPPPPQGDKTPPPPPQSQGPGNGNPHPGK